MIDKNIYLIAAVAQNGAIGKDGGIPWHIPQDFALFKEKTMGKDVIMGRGTLESLKRLLPGRRHIVISSTMSSRDGIIVVPTIEDALHEANEGAFVIGGEPVYRASLPYVDQMYISHVHTIVEDADRFFPVSDFSQFPVLESRRYDDFTFSRYLNH